MLFDRKCRSHVTRHCVWAACGCLWNCQFCSSAEAMARQFKQATMVQRKKRSFHFLSGEYINFVTFDTVSKPCNIKPTIINQLNECLSFTKMNDRSLIQRRRFTSRFPTHNEWEVGSKRELIILFLQHSQREHHLFKNIYKLLSICVIRNNYS